MPFFSKDSQGVAGPGRGLVAPLLALLLASGAAFAAGRPPVIGKPAGTVRDQADAQIYLPAGLAAGQRHPIVFAFSPGADARGLIRFWKPLADKHHFIVYASKEYRNEMPDLQQKLPVIHGHLQAALQQTQADPQRVILTGMSGGGSFSQVLAIQYPGFASAMIVNTGRIWDPWYAHAEQHKESYRATYAHAGQANRIVLLMSPTDFRYKEMARDQLLWQALGWHVQRSEFKGGHKVAPAALYEQSLQWIFSGWR